MSATASTTALTSTLLETVRESVAVRGPDVALTFLRDGEGDAVDVTFDELDAAARAVAARLQATGVRPGDRVMLVETPGPNLVSGFLGCVYAGATAVPTPSPSNFLGERGAERLLRIAEDAAAVAIVTGSAHQDQPLLAGTRHLAKILVDSAADAADSYDPPPVRPEDVAFLQYTSGSTSAPRGVRVTHAALATNIRLLERSYGLTSESVVVSWLPPFHDMGLIATILTPLSVGFRSVQMTPEAFIRRPERWLRAISRYRGTISFAPDFAYALCVRRVADTSGLDLSSWTVAVNGAEPVRESTLAEFSDKFATCGFREDAFYPSYGLAEATLLVTAGRRRAGSTLYVDREALAAGVVETRPDGKPLVSCGSAPDGTAVAVIDPHSGAPVPEGHVGEIVVVGRHVCDGYWGHPEAEHETFAFDGLHTGDLGAIVSGELYVTGRRKDMLILRGQNIYPQDIELTMERAGPAVRPGCGIATSMSTDSDELLILVQEVKPDAAPDAQAVVDTIMRLVTEEHAVRPDAVILVAPRTLPKTTSGKLRRSAAATAFRDGTLDVVHQWVGASLS